MKILNLEFENINSFEESIRIDFEDPGFQKGNNQFVISGPMGAGKTTILDAITLALYGSTPRLDHLKKNEDKFNELINKHSGYCRAEVTYSCSEGVFASAFYVHKAHHKVDGSIQSPKCTVKNKTHGDDAKNLLDSSSSIDELRRFTEKNIGLNYEQFIRCILIPQGEFDKFLTSNDREKAQILAKLSHTEHYKAAAVALKNKAATVEKNYKTLIGMRDAIPVMKEDERKESEEKKKELEKKCKAQRIQIDEMEIIISRIMQFQQADDALVEAGEELNEVKAGEAEHKRKADELERAKKANECNIAFRDLQHCIDGQKKALEQKALEEDRLDGLITDQNEANDQFNTCKNEYDRKRTERIERHELWNRVRELDKDISVAKAARDTKKESEVKARKTLDGKTNELKTYAEKIDQISPKAQELKEYLEKNNADAVLEVMLATYKEKRKAWKTAADQLIKAQKEEDSDIEKKKAIEAERKMLEDEYDRISGELFSLVSSKYLLVSGILRQELKPGKPCPVCGQVVISADGPKEQGNHEDNQSELTDTQSEVAKSISNLTDELEKYKADIDKKIEEQHRVENAIESARQKAEQAIANISDLRSELNNLLQPWAIQLGEDISEEELKTIEEDLSIRKRNYDENNKTCNRLQSEIEKAQNAMGGINLEELKEAYDTAYNEYDEADQHYQDLDNQRTDLFGKTSVEAAEKAYDAELKKIENAKDAAHNELQTKKDAVKETQTKINGFIEQYEKLQEEQTGLEEVFSMKLRENGFVSEEEYRSCLKGKAEFNALQKDVEDFLNKLTVAQTTYDNAKNALIGLGEKPQTDKTLEELIAEKTNLSKLKEDNDRLFGVYEEKLEQDSKNQTEWNKKNEEIKQLGEEAEIYSKISEMIGKGDGADFEVFVQGIAMHSLLDKATGYLNSILPNYRLVQKEKDSIAFQVYALGGDGKEDKRETYNFSGGEKFILSLSLALAMAEFAGKTGTVESIFLDEGFGTLSGEPLMQAISALKKLGATGKTLGIITHIDAVIREFNQIEAIKKGEKSTLKGPGVTCSSRTNHTP